MKIVARVFCVLGCLGLGLLHGQSVWVVDSLQRVGQSDPVGSASSIGLYAAKGESESFQVVVRAPGGGLSQVNLTPSDLQGPGGATISRQNLTLYREYYVNVTAPSPDFGVGNRPLGAGWYPDALIPFTDPSTGLNLTGATYQAVPYNLAGNQNQPFWVDINVPRGAVAGDYTGTITVSSSLGSSLVGFTLRVWNFTLPVASRLKSTFGFHGNEGYLQNNIVLLQHRVQPFTIIPGDLSTLQTLGAQIVGLPYFNQSSGCAIETPPSASTIASAMAAYPYGFPTYVYPADEVNGCPNLQQNLQAWAQVAHAAGTKTLVTVVPDPTLMDDGTGSGRSDVDIWAVLPKQYCSNINLTPCVVTSAIPQVIAKGDEVWSYTEQEQDYYSPKWLIDFAPINYRIFPGFINQQFRFTGMLYSDVAHWSSDPWNNVQSWTAGGYTFPGDDMLVYPGQQVGLPFVVPSMRLKFIRDGVDDFDYMAMLKEQGQGALVAQILNNIVPDWKNWTKDTTALQSARIQMGQQLDLLGGGSATPPSNPWPASGTTSPATTLTLQWSTVPGVTQYQVYFGTSSTNLPLYATVSSSSGVANQAVYNLSGGTVYYWKVVALGATSVSGPIWSFATPSTASLQPPSNPWPFVGNTGIAGTLTLQWSAVSGATQYQVYFGTNSSNLSLYATVTSLGSTVNSAVYNLSHATTYYWQVVAINGSTSASGPIWWFTTN